MSHNPFSSMRFSSVFDKAEEPFNRKRFLSNIFPLQSRPIETPQVQVPETKSSLSGSVVEPDEQDEAGKYWDEMQTLRGRRGPALTAYQQHLDAIPTRESKKAGVGRKIAAALAGAGAGLQQGFGAGVQTAQSLVEAPYNRALGEWSNKAKVLGESASLEREEVEQELKALAEARALGLKYDEFRLRQLETEHGMRSKDADLEIKSRLADLQEARDQAVDERSRRQIDAQIQYWQGQLEVGSYNAQTSRMNAATNRQRAGDQSRYQDESIKVRREAIAASIANSIRRADGSRPSPDEQLDAVDNALFQLQSDPKFRNFIETDDQGNRVPVEDDGSPMYREFQRRLRSIAKKSLEEGSMFDEDIPLEDDSDIEIFEEPQ